MKNFTTEITEFHGVVDTKIVFPPCSSVYSVVFYSGVTKKPPCVSNARHGIVFYIIFLICFFNIFFVIME